MIGIYCRISREKEIGKDRSIEDQRLLGIELAQSLKKKYKVYIDRGISGTVDNLEERPAFNEMIEDIQDGIIDSIYAFDQSRLERNPQIRFVLKKILTEFNVRLFTSNGEVNMHDDESEMLGDILSVMNQYYVKITTKKIKSVLKRNAQQGKAHGRIMPLGYKKDANGYLVVNEDEASIVREIYDKSLNGIGSSTIKNWLNEKNIPTRYNRLPGTLTIRNKYTGEVKKKDKKDIKWSDKTVQDILRNPIYKGERRWKGEYYKCPPIFEKSYWDRVNENLTKNKNRSGKKVDHKYLLKGLIRCGKCDRNYYGRKRPNNKDNFYMCSSKRIKSLNCGNRSINIDALESFIWERFFVDNRLIEKVKSQLKNSDDDKVPELQKTLINVKSVLEEQKLRRERVISAISTGILSEREAFKVLKNIRTNVSDTKRKIENLENQIEIYTDRRMKSSLVEEDLVALKLDTPYNEQRQLIHKYLKNIEVLWCRNGFYSLIIEFNSPLMKKDHVLLDWRYRFALDTERNYFIGLSQDLQDRNLSKKEIDSLIKDKNEITFWTKLYDPNFVPKYSNIKT